MKSFVLHNRMLTGLILCKSCTIKHRCCEVIRDTTGNPSKLLSLTLPTPPFAFRTISWTFLFRWLIWGWTLCRNFFSILWQVISSCVIFYPLGGKKLLWWGLKASLISQHRCKYLDSLWYCARLAKQQLWVSRRAYEVNVFLDRYLTFQTYIYN